MNGCSKSRKTGSMVRYNEVTGQTLDIRDETDNAHPVG